MTSNPPPPPPPPLSALPPKLNVKSQPDYHHSSPPHLEEPLLAPRPHKLTPGLPAEMARTLDSQVSRDLSIPPPPPVDNHRGPSPSLTPGALNLTPGFIVPTSSTSPAPLPPPMGSSWSPWNIPQSGSPPSIQTNLPPPLPSNTVHQPFLHRAEPSHHSPLQPLPYPGPASPSDSLSPDIASMSISDTSQKKAPESSGPPSLTATLPTIASLIAILPSVQNLDNSPHLRLLDPPSGPVNVADQELNHLVEIAVPLILQIANPNPVPQPLPLHVAEAIYLRATFEATGAYPKFVPQNPRTAFRDYERAGRAGYSAAWFKIGRDYENFGDFPHAKDCYERGIRSNNESCLYRVGMAHLMGQLGLPSNPEAAIPLLQRAATLATVDVPQPAYVFGLLLLGEFSHASIPPHLFTSLIPPSSTRDNEARRHLERAAYLNFAPAQYKLGHAYEFAQPPFPFDALLSVQYYSLASQQGETEADMALSKWFLCGSEGAFDKDESLAFTFAEKAARKGLPSAEFAMGYYMEVGVGGPKDIEAARKWYTRASQHGNTDAAERLAALSQPAPQALSRQEHDNLTETTLVRKRTQAKQRSDAREPTVGPQHRGRQNSQQVVANIRKNSLAYRPGPSPGFPSPSIPVPTRADNPPAGINDGYANNSYRQPSLGTLNANSEVYPPQLAPAQGPLSTSLGSGGNRPPAQSSAGPGGYSPVPHQQSLPPPQPQSSLPPQGINSGPTRYPSPRISVQQQYGQLGRPMQQSTGPGLGGPGRRPLRATSGSGPAPPGSGPLAQTPGPAAPSRPAVYDPPMPPPPAKGPATFQEMGFQSQKLENKDCVIM
ncbi:hypothetical protein B0F90DRAFT_1817633 [Multifurca ochricompacta]|uniref:HCP-like protein n=1 Tax=Multifurca ochricompacta TaxID=376703 RepID=A0AAD4M5L8_9AGAM|nr:hypothetical protein B0F90DRAFT_1817633 [Multifurca ochricompacta]